MQNLDITDLKILNLLQENARATIKEIAAKAGISTTPAYERMKRLEKRGYIKGYSVQIDKDKIDRKLTVFCQISLPSHTKQVIREFEAHVQQFPEIMECFHTAGNFDYLLKIMVKDMEAYQKFIVEKLSTTETIANIQSIFVMKDIKYDTRFKLL